MIHTILIIVGAVTLLFLLISGARALFFGLRAVQSGKNSTPASRTVEAPLKRVLVIGDSTAYGTGASCPECSFVGRLIEDYPHIHIDNLAENAMDFKRLVEKLAHLHNTTYDTVIIMVGGMDVIRFTLYETIAKNVALIKEHCARLGATQVILISPNNVGNAPIWSFPLSTLFTIRSKIFSEFLGTLTEKYAILHVPLYRAREEDPLVTQTDLFAEDGTHPNDQGHALWYTHIKTVIHPHILHD